MACGDILISPTPGSGSVRQVPAFSRNPGRYRVDTWAFKGPPYHDFGDFEPQAALYSWSPIAPCSSMCGSFSRCQARVMWLAALQS